VSGGSLSRRLSKAPPYSYRNDPAVPDFPDDKALIVFDGVCVLCSRLVTFAIDRDPDAAFRLCTAQSEVGQALFRHYGLDTDSYETNLVLVEGRAYGKLDSVVVVGRKLGGIWRLASGLLILPRPVSDWLYDRIAHKRYDLFGRTERCMIPKPEWRGRFLE
jgi:predicted DCC family thiol-disulfide oxidoreductase YuxK